MLWCEAEKLLLSGDQILPRITSNIGVYATEPEGDPLGEWLHSCARLRDRLSDDILVLPGHNEPFTGARIRLAQLLDHHAEGLSALAEFLTEPRTIIECFDVLFDRKITDQLLGFATVEAVAHLNNLHQSGRATRREENGVYRFTRAVD
jgi:glyoxylase-like metal-dependent hydrolase (beta-lactamase superfamily II)